MAIDGFIYKPLDESLIERIKGTKGINLGEYDSRRFCEVTRLKGKGVSSAQLIFGKDIEIPFGTQSQGPDSKEGTKHLDYLVGLVVDGPNTHKRGYRESIEKLMLEYLGVQKNAIEYLGIYSGDRAKFVTDFEN